MQNYIKKTSVINLNKIIEIIKDDFGTLMTDSYANYFCQKLLHNLTSDQRLTILRALAKDFVLVSCDEVGTHPMQRLVEMVNMEEEREIIFSAIQNDIVHLAFHPKGNYVLILAIQILKDDKFNFIVEQLIEHIPKLSLD